MIEKSRYCVDAAIAFANLPQHGGNGYELNIVIEGKEPVQGVVSSYLQQPDDVLFLLVHEPESGETLEVFVDKARVISATIIW